MEKHKYIYVIFILTIFVLFSLFQFDKTRHYRVLKVNTPFEIYIDINNNGVVDEDEKYNIKSELNVLTLTNINLSLWNELKLDAATLTVFAYLTEKYANDVLLDKNITLKNKHGKKEVFVSGNNYIDILEKSGYVFREGKPVNYNAFDKRVQQIKKNEYKLYNVRSNKLHLPTCKYGQQAHNYVLLSKYQIPKEALPCKYCLADKNKHTHVKPSTKNIQKPVYIFESGAIKILLSDYTNNLIPNRKGNTKICKEIIKQIDLAESTIDIAIYGYDRVPAVEAALKRAKARGVKIRLVCDADMQGKNIYQDTAFFTKFIGNYVCDVPSCFIGNKKVYSNYIMHNKFYIFDNSTVITGSANLSHTDMSDFNANALVVIRSKEIAKIYTEEFEQMYNKIFHNLKMPILNKSGIKLGESIISVYFSPSDNIISSGLIPLIKSARKYIYIPVFVITDRNITNALIQAKQRGVDVRLIIDAANAKNKYSTHKILRQNGIQVKTENYAGKLHSKSIIIDDLYSVIGSMNFSKSGESRNDENVLIIKNKNLAIFYKKYFDYLWSKISNYWLTHDVSAESSYSIGSCNDGIDNDYDGLIDAEDDGCKFKPKKSN